MALIEIELPANTFANLTLFILSKSPIPAPTLDLLGPTRLLSKPIQWSNPITSAMLPGGTLPPGTLALQASAVISHVSVAELLDNPLAPSQDTECVAWMTVTLESTRFKIDLVRLERPGGPVHVFATPLFIGQQFVPLGLEDIRATALLREGDYVTVRYSVGGSDNLLQTPANRLEQALTEEWPYRDPVPSAVSDTWLFHVSGEVFANQMRDQLVKALADLPTDTTIEQSPATVWYQQPPSPAPFDSGPGALQTNQWGVVGAVGIKQEEPCPGVDVSVMIRATLTLLPDIAQDRVTLGLRLSSDVSDWDSFRCWITYGGLGVTVFATALGGLVSGLMAGLATAVAVGELIRLQAGGQVTKQRAGSFQRVDGDDTAVWYTGSQPLPRLPNGVGLSAKVGAEGLLIKGGLAPPFAGVNHTITFEPEGGALEAHWRGSYDCAKRRWKASYLVQSIIVRDLIRQDGVVLEGPGTVVFPTSRFISPVSPALLIDPGEWTYDAPTVPIGSPVITPRRTSPPPVGDRMFFILHTNAGIRRYEIGPVPVIPASQLAPGLEPEPDIDPLLGVAVGRRTEPATEPSGILLGMLDAQCRTTTRHWDRIKQLHWIVDPPPFDYGIPAVRQWLLTFRDLPESAEVSVRSIAGNRDTHVDRAFRGSRSGFVEFVSEHASSTTIEHNLGETNAEVGVKQRWLLPTSRILLGGQAEGLSVVRDPSGGERVLVTVNGSTFVVQSGELEEWAGAEQPARSAPPKSVTLRNGQIAVVSGDTLMIAVPWGPK